MVADEEEKGQEKEEKRNDDRRMDVKEKEKMPIGENAHANDNRAVPGIVSIFCWTIFELVEILV